MGKIFQHTIRGDRRRGDEQFPRRRQLVKLTIDAFRNLSEKRVPAGVINLRAEGPKFKFANKTGSFEPGIAQLLRRAIIKLPLTPKGAA
jgi:hypothetical protein